MVDEICACDKIACTSLHGLIIAQSYGIPVLYLQNQQEILRKNSTFKFDDYCLGVQQPVFTPLAFSSASDLIAKLQSPQLHFRDPVALRSFAQNLLDVFPYPEQLQISSLPN